MIENIISSRGTSFWKILLSLAFTFSFSSTVRAETKQLNLTVFPKVGQSFASLLQEAETSVKDITNQVFRTQTEVTDLSINVLGDKHGELVPLISVTVLRDNWQKGNSILTQAKYFDSAELLTGARRVNRPVAARSAPDNPNSEPNFYK